MKTTENERKIYLRCVSLECLIEDIRKAFPDYDGSADYSCGSSGVHLIGDIPVTYDEDGNPVTGTGLQHANVFVHENFDETIFQTRMPVPPNNPVNNLAI